MYRGAMFHPNDIAKVNAVSELAKRGIDIVRVIKMTKRGVVTAVCEKTGKTVRLHSSMLGPLDAGTVVRYFNGQAVYVLGKCRRRDEGRIGHDVQCRPVRLGAGPYTFVTAPDCLDEAPE